MATISAPAKSLSNLPGPRRLPVIGNLHQIDMPRLHQSLEAWAAEFGPIFSVQLGRRRVVCITDHERMSEMLRERPDLYRRPRTTERVFEEMGIHGIFSQDGDAWKRQRRVVQHAFNPAHLSRFYPAMATSTERLRQRWVKSSGEPFDLCRDLMRYTVDITAHLAFGIDVNTLETDGPVIQQHLDKVFPAIFKRIVAPIPYWRYFRLPADRVLDNALQEIRSTVIEVTLECRRNMQANPDLYDKPTNFLEAIIAAQKTEGVEFSDEEIYANVIQLLLAGEDTTANTIAWAVKYLIDNQALYAEARTEARTEFGDALIGPDIDALKSLDLIEAIASETMRLKPVAPMLGIEPKEAIELYGYEIPAGTSILGLCRPDAVKEENFAAADQFRPKRWLDDAGDQTHNPRAYLPFGTGPRFCPGRGLALVEIKAVLGMLCRNFDIALAPGGPAVTERLAFTMFPENLNVVFSHRPN